MELHQPIPQASYPSRHNLLDNSSGLAKARQPLSDSVGNAQLNTLASVGSYHDVKGLLPRERSMYSIPMLPSQPSRQSIASTLEHRRHPHRQRTHRQKYMAIAELEVYKRYREKIGRESSEEAKWPDELEEPFLDGRQLLNCIRRTSNDK